MMSAGFCVSPTFHMVETTNTGTSTPTITVEIESDSQEDFAGTPETRLSFDAATARGGQILRTDGTAHADTWYRPTWTVSGTSPSFLFVVALGIR